MRRDRAALSKCCFLPLLCLQAALPILLSGCTEEKPAVSQPPRPPAPVTDLFVAVSDTTSLLLTWTASGAHDTLGTAARYDLRRALVDTTAWNGMIPVPGVRAPKSAGQPESLRVFGLTPETRYYFQLQMISPDSLPSELSNRAEGVTGRPDRIPPGGTSLEFASATEHTISIRWVAPGDDGDLGTAARYELYLRPNWASEWLPVDAPSHPKPAGQIESAVMTGLEPGMHYLARLETFDEAGNRKTALPEYFLWTAVADDAHWSATFAPAPEGEGINGQVRALASYGGLLVAGGAFTQSGSTVVSSLAAWNGSEWSSLGATGVAGERATVNHLLVVGNELIAAGSYTSIDGVAAHSIARWDGSGWHAMGEGSSREVTDLTILGGSLVAAGGFGVDSRIVGIARWDGTAWQEIAPDPPGAYIEAMDGMLYGNSGDESTLPDSTVWISRLEGQVWRPLLVAPTAAPLPYVFPQVRNLLAWQGRLYVCGTLFTQYGTDMIVWDGSSWYGLGPPLSSGQSDMWVPEIMVLAGFGDAIIAGGSFFIRDQPQSNSILRGDGSGWRPFGSGIGLGATHYDTPDGTVLALCEHQGSLYVGGAFTHAGRKPSRNIARWDP